MCLWARDWAPSHLPQGASKAALSSGPKQGNFQVHSPPRGFSTPLHPHGCHIHARSCTDFFLSFSTRMSEPISTLPIPEMKREVRGEGGFSLSPTAQRLNEVLWVWFLGLSSLPPQAWSLLLGQLDPAGEACPPKSFTHTQARQHPWQSLQPLAAQGVRSQVFPKRPSPTHPKSPEHTCLPTCTLGLPWSFPSRLPSSPAPTTPFSLTGKPAHTSLWWDGSTFCWSLQAAESLSGFLFMLTSLGNGEAERGSDAGPGLFLHR